MSKTLFLEGWRRSWKLLVIFMAVLTMYCAMIISMFDPSMGESLELMAASMPELFSAFGMSDAGSTLLEFISNYLYGFLLLVFPIVFMLILARRLICAPIEGGSMAYLLSGPNRRGKIILTQAFVLFSQLVLLVAYVTALCVIVSGAMFPGELPLGEFLMINVGLLGVHLFFSGACYFCACLWGGTKWALTVGSGLCIASLLLQMISRVGEKFEFVKYATPLTLFDPREIAVPHVMILILAGLLLYGLGSAVFCRRDLCL